MGLYCEGCVKHERVRGALLEALKDFLDVTNGVRGLPTEDDGPCEDLCGNSWCHEFGCIPMKFAAARAAIAKAEGHE